VGAAVAPAQKPSNTPGNASGSKDDDKPDDGKTASDQAGAAQTAQTQAAQSQPAPSAGKVQPPPANESDQDASDQTAADQILPDQGPSPLPDTQQADLTTAPLVSGDDQPISDTIGDTASDADNVSFWPQSARPQLPTGQAGKTDKTDKADKSDRKDAKDQPARPDLSNLVATDLLSPELQIAAVTPPPAPQATVPPVTDDSDQTETAATPAIAPAAQPLTPLPADPGSQTPDPAAPQSADQIADQDAPQAAGPATPQPAVTPPTPKMMPSAPAVAAANLDTDQDGTDQRQILPPKDAPAVNSTKAQPKPAAAKADAGAKTTKPSPGKMQQANDPAAVKSADTTASADDADDSIKADSVKTAAPAADPAAPKPAVNTANMIAVLATGQPVPPQTQAPDLTQHIQVTAQPHDTPPNLPALAVEIAAKSLGGAKQFDIRLDPPELGRVEVRLSIDATGKASAHLSADQPQTLNLLQRDAPLLTRALRDAGLDVSQNGLNFSLRQQSGQDAGAGANPGRRSGRGLSLTATTSIEATAASAAYSGPADGRLDIRV
jgi:hypothetical protein